MDKTTTERGFTYYKFTDSNQVVCTLQKSSSAMEDKIWLGAKEIGLKHFKAFEGWKDVELADSVEEHYIANNRMHLTREQVKELIPILQLFVDTGEI